METEIRPLPYFFIGQEETDQRTAQFLSVKYPLLCDAIGKQDTRNIWYSRDHVAKLLEEIDHVGGDGLRIFFGSYDPTHTLFAKQTCLVMNPTREKIVGGMSSHEDVILEYEPDFNERSSLPRAQPLFPPADTPERDRGYNYGSPCPPLCDR